ncbi:MAG: FKBP-type peptidyl-prolyl cis-trans isomerase [Chloroflexi bacterium]|nr:FKBP-type peptidyl-prolyl cis-trans isomerase [Chloroflexota bacterium]
MFALALVACGGDGDTEDITEETPTVETPTVQITDIVVGTGQTVVAGDTVTVHYTGWLADGTEFDSSVGGDPITFPLEGLIAGWKEGIPGMQPGGKRTLVIPPELAYGEAGRPGIPPNSTLTFEIELISIQ